MKICGTIISTWKCFIFQNTVNNFNEEEPIVHVLPSDHEQPPISHTDITLTEYLKDNYSSEYIINNYVSLLVAFDVSVLLLFCFILLFVINITIFFYYNNLCSCDLIKTKLKKSNFPFLATEQFFLRQGAKESSKHGSPQESFI